MTTADCADIFIRAAELQEDPWAEPEAEFQAVAESGFSTMRLAALYIGGGAWGTFLGVAFWRAYEFVMGAETAAIVAQLN